MHWNTLINWKFSRTNGRPSEVLYFFRSNRLERKLPFHLYKNSISTARESFRASTYSLRHQDLPMRLQVFRRHRNAFPFNKENLRNFKPKIVGKWKAPLVILTDTNSPPHFRGPHCCCTGALLLKRVWWWSNWNSWKSPSSSSALISMVTSNCTSRLFREWEFPGWVSWKKKINKILLLNVGQLSLKRPPLVHRKVVA